MKLKLKSLAILCFISLHLLGSIDSLKQEKPIVLETKTGKIRGTILVPEGKAAVPVVLIIAGSGPTDRNGNNSMMKNNSNKMLAEELFKNNIASVRYDKRGIAESKDAGPEEKDLRFDNYVNDVTDWIKLLKKDHRFSKIIIAGHSEGSLLGMIAANLENVNAYISIAGAGRSADKILKEQLKAQPQQVIDMCYSIIDSLVKGKQVNDINPALNVLFRPSVQPYMISWFKYDPQTEIKKLTIPILILQGTTDIQVSVDDAKLLSNANPKAKMVLIENMNHVLKNAEADRQKNSATYNDPNLPINSDFLKEIDTFITGLK